MGRCGLDQCGRREELVEGSCSEWSEIPGYILIIVIIIIVIIIIIIIIIIYLFTYLLI
jgi:hypothetical protein